jgi:septal ring factor EnvC (AmiA/AmiB activator)
VRFQLRELLVVTTESQERIEFAPDVTFLHGPISTGKSTTVRLVDYCLGGRLEETPAVQNAFVAAALLAEVGDAAVRFERSSSDAGHVRVTWTRADEEAAVNAPIDPGPRPIIGDAVFNLSDLIFHLAGIKPIRVRRSKRDPEASLVRLSFRDLMWYCYLKQDKLDSSFYRLEDTFKRLKSMDAMRFVTGLYSERLNELDAELAAAQDDQRGKRAAVDELRRFLAQFELASPLEIQARIEGAKGELAAADARKKAIEAEHAHATHVVEPMRERLRRLSDMIANERAAYEDLRERIQEQRSVRSQLITAQVKAARVSASASVLEGVEFEQCPRCGSGIAGRAVSNNACVLCLTPSEETKRPTALVEAFRRDVDTRIDDLADSIRRHQRECKKQEKRIEDLVHEKAQLDADLSAELARYDSAYVASVRGEERKSATFQERIASLQRLIQMPAAIDTLEREAAELQVRISHLRAAMGEERARLVGADKNIRSLEEKFLAVMRQVGFPDVAEGDVVRINTRDWVPFVIHGDVEWSFDGAGSGGKKTLFNVCYAIAVHEVAIEAELPLPAFLIVDSPTKNISRDINPAIVGSLYRYMYDMVARAKARGRALQLVLVDSDLVLPEVPLEFAERLMSDRDPEHPKLFSRYEGP